MNGQYFLYRDSDAPVISVFPIDDKSSNVVNLTGAYFSGREKVMTENEILQLKSVHNLYYEQELGSQLTIFDLPEGSHE